MPVMTSVDAFDPGAARLFLAVAELGSVSKAANRMHMSQPSATAKIHKLEKLLGVTLLERHPTGSHVTAAGARLVVAIDEALTAVAEVIDIAETTRHGTVHLDIAATRHITDHFLTGWLRGVDAGAVTVTVSEVDTLRAAQAVRAGDASLGFTEGPSAPIGLRSEVVDSEQVVAVVGRTHPWAQRRSPVTADELGRAPLVMTRHGSGLRDVVDSALHSHGVGRPAHRVEVASSSAARLAAITGAGLTFLPRCWVDSLCSDGSLVAVSTELGEILLPIRVVWRGSRPSNPPAAALVDSLIGRSSRPADDW